MDIQEFANRYVVGKSYTTDLLGGTFGTITALVTAFEYHSGQRSVVVVQLSGFMTTYFFREWGIEYMDVQVYLKRGYSLAHYEPLLIAEIMKTLKYVNFLEDDIELDY
jgi:hypothetical protein